MTDRATIFCTNALEIGTSFAVRLDTGEQVFIPASVAKSAGVQVGDELEALLVVNVHHEDKTPWFAYNVTKSSPEGQPEPTLEPSPTSDAAEFTRETMRDGGVWTNATMYAEYYAEYMGDPDAARTDNIVAYNLIGRTLRSMFSDGECAKWSMWASSLQSKASKEWFSCYPARADVDEFGE